MDVVLRKGNREAQTRGHMVTPNLFQLSTHGGGEKGSQIKPKDKLLMLGLNMVITKVLTFSNFCLMGNF